MDIRKNKNHPATKSTSFKPDKNYIKNAMEEYERRGGKISKLESGSSFYSDMTTAADRLS